MVVKVAFFDAYYDSFAGAQKSMLPLAKHGNSYDSTVCVPKRGELTERCLREEINTRVIEYADRLDRFDKQLLDQSIISKVRSGVCLMGYYWKVKKFLNDNEYDIIYCNNLRSTILYAPPAKLLNIPVLTYVRGDKRIGAFDKARLYLSDEVICISDQVLKRFSSKERDRFSGKISTINTGVDTDLFDPDRFHSEYRDEIVISQVATLQERKGQMTLLEAANKLDCDDIKIQFIGSTPEGQSDYRDQLFKTRDRLGINHIVEFIGWRDDIPELLNETDLFVLPSLNEGLPRSLLEAAAMELPMIATPAGGTKELVKDGVTGYIIPKGDSDKLANRIDYLADRPQKRENMGKKARQMVISRYSIDAYVRNFEELLSSYTMDL